MELARKRLFLLDLDGVLSPDQEPCAETTAFLQYVQSFGGTYLYLTNDSSRSALSFADELAGMGIHVKTSAFLTSADALMDDLRRKKKPEDVYYVFGTRAFRTQLEKAGFTVCSTPDDSVTTLVCGFDTELTFQKLQDACRLLSRNVDFIATNQDLVRPTRQGYVPDCGSVCEMLTRATGRRPRFIGKPRPAMVYLALDRCGCTPGETLMVGDRSYTDIACGVNAGVDSALLLSGKISAQSLRASSVKPTAVFSGMGALLAALQRARTSSPPGIPREDAE